MTDKGRIEWVDTLKFLGILAIYVGHFLELGGLSHKFIFAFAVELFFFVSGLFALCHMDRSFGERLWKRFMGIVAPYFFFSILTVLVVAVQGNLGFSEIRPMGRQIVLGIRNRTVAPTLWFLPCLFVVFILYELLYRLIKNEWLLIGIGLLLYAAAAAWLRPVENPRWFFNIDSAVYYFFFYALGAAFYQKYSMRGRESGRIQKTMTVLAVLCILLVSGYMYFGKMIDAYQALRVIPGFTLFYPLLISVVLILFQILLAHVLSRIPLLGKIGKKTLYLCGNEYLVKLLAPECLGIFGLGVELSNPLRVYLYSFALIYMAYRFLIPPEEKLLTILDIFEKRGYTNRDS